jgi:hypothetical protein
MKPLLGIAIALLLLGGCGSPPEPTGAARRSSPSQDPSPGTREVRGCPLTIPPHPGFVPPEPYPARPPDLYRSVWYGTAELWTMLAPEGEVWEDLPEDDGHFAQKTTWWSERFIPGEEPAPSLTVAGRRLDRPGSFEVGGPAGGGHRDDIGSFMLVGLDIAGGCWELTAAYRGAELSYVVLVGD